MRFVGSTAFLGILVAVVVASPMAASWDYYPLRLHELAGRAELIVLGEIAEVRDETFLFAIDEVVAGEVESDRVVVRRFQDWTCAGRGVDYRAGQEALLFLELVPEEIRDRVPGKYRVLSGGNEGELPRLGEELIFKGRGMRAYPDGEHQVEGGNWYGCRVSREELITAVQRYRALFRVRFDPVPPDYYYFTVEPLGSEEELDVFARSSATARHLVESSRSSLGYLDPDPPESPAKRKGSLPRIPFTVLFDPSGAGISACEVVGDLDGDGREEIALGAARDSRWGPKHGALRLLGFAAEGERRRCRRIDERSAGFDGSLVEWGSFGFSLASLGDLDGDGTLELAVGAPRQPGGGERRGEVRILSLDSDGTMRTCMRIGGDHPVFGGTIGDAFQLGEHLAAVGDVNGDGIGDLAVSEREVSGFDFLRQARASQREGAEHALPSFEIPTTEAGIPFGKSGAIWILFLGADGMPIGAGRMGALPGPRYHEHGSLHSFRGGFCSLGDLDGDGIRELAAGDGFDDDGGEMHGAVWILFPDRDGRERHRQKISDWHGGFTGQLRDGGKFGAALAAPGDVDGDQIPDLVVGAPEDPDGGRGKGALWVLFLRRDGTVRDQTKISDLHGGFTEPLPERAQLGRRVTAGRGGKPRLVVPGSDGSGGDRRRFLWLLDLTSEGRIAGGH